ncbi:MAG: O-antigen ligase family protein [Nocardioidaceae bacterium]
MRWPHELRPVAVALTGAVIGTLFGFVLGVAWGGGGLLPFAVGLAVVAMYVVSWQPLVGILLVPALVGVGNDPIPGAPFGLQVVHVLVGFALAGVGLHLVLYLDHRVRRPSVATRRAFVAIGAFVAVSWFSGLLGVAPSTALTANLTLTGAALLAVGISISVCTQRQLRLFVVVVVLGSIAATAPVLGQLGDVESRRGGTVVDNRPTGAFADPNELGIYAVVIVVLALTLLAVGRRLELVVGVVGGGFALAGLLLSFSRGAWLAALAAGVVLLAYPLMRGRILRVLAVGVLVAGLLVSTSVVDLPVGALQDRASSLLSGASNPYDARPAIWQTALGIFVDHPLLGAGPGSFSTVVAEAPGFLWAYPVVHAHSGPLTVAAETGALGLLTSLAVVLVVGAGLLGGRLRGSGDPSATGLLHGILAALCGVGACLGVDYTLRNPLVLTMVWMLVGIALAASQLSESAADETSVDAPHAVVR